MEIRHGLKTFSVCVIIIVREHLILNFYILTDHSNMWFTGSDKLSHFHNFRTSCSLARYNHDLDLQLEHKSFDWWSLRYVIHQVNSSKDLLWHLKLTPPVTKSSQNPQVVWLMEKAEKICKGINHSIYMQKNNTCIYATINRRETFNNKKNCNKNRKRVYYNKIL